MAVKLDVPHSLIGKAYCKVYYNLSLRVFRSNADRLV